LEEAFLEKDVIETTRRYLQANGYIIIYGERGGPDLVAYNNVKNELLVIEVRGVPTRHKIKGRDKGESKKGSTIRSQFRNWPDKIIAELMDREYEWIHRTKPWVAEVIEKIEKIGTRKPPAVRYVGVLGYHEKYLEVLEKKKHALSKLGYEFWLIDKESNIRYSYPPWYSHKSNLLHWVV